MVVASRRFGIVGFANGSEGLLAFGLWVPTFPPRLEEVGMTIAPFTAALTLVAASEENRDEIDCGGYERTLAVW
jgi:hypothetical protein